VAFQGYFVKRDGAAADNDGVQAHDGSSSAVSPRCCDPKLHNGVSARLNSIRANTDTKYAIHENE
jgi:hypothetical protein